MRPSSFYSIQVGFVKLILIGLLCYQRTTRERSKLARSSKYPWKRWIRRFENICSLKQSICSENCNNHFQFLVSRFRKILKSDVQWPHSAENICWDPFQKVMLIEKIGVQKGGYTIFHAKLFFL